MTFKEEYAKAKLETAEVIETPVKVEQVVPMQGWVSEALTVVFGLAARVLIVWWAVAVWFPQLGLTYWQLVLPVYAVRMLITSNPHRLRTFKVKRWALRPVS